MQRLRYRRGTHVFKLAAGNVCDSSGKVSFLHCAVTNYDHLVKSVRLFLHHDCEIVGCGDLDYLFLETDICYLEGIAGFSLD